MGGSTTTSAQIPNVLVPLFQNTARNIMNWQNWFQGGIPTYQKREGNPSDELVYDSKNDRWIPKETAAGGPTGGSPASQDPIVVVRPGDPPPTEPPYDPNDPTREGPRPGGGPGTPRQPPDIRGGGGGLVEGDDYWWLPQGGSSWVGDPTGEPGGGGSGTGWEPGSFPLWSIMDWNPLTEMYAPNEYTKAYGENIRGLWDRPDPEAYANNWAFQALGEAGNQPTMWNLDTPYMANSLKAWDDTVGQQMNNDYSTMGLGRSTGLADNKAKARSQFMLPLLSEQANYENQALNRKQGAYQSGIGTLLETGGRETARNQTGMNALLNYGDILRTYGKEAGSGFQDERARMQNLFEQSMWQPFGSFVPATIGSSTKSK